MIEMVLAGRRYSWAHLSLCLPHLEDVENPNIIRKPTNPFLLNQRDTARPCDRHIFLLQLLHARVMRLLCEE
jgi:hypothetical protein